MLQPQRRKLAIPDMASLALSKDKLMFYYTGQRFLYIFQLYPSKRSMLPSSCKRANLNALWIPLIPAYLMLSIDIVRLRQRQFCGRVRFTCHSICFDDLDLQPFASARASSKVTRLLTYVSGSTFIFGI